MLARLRRILQGVSLFLVLPACGGGGGSSGPPGNESLAANLVTGDTNGASDIFVHDRATGVTTRASVASDGSQGNGLSFFRPSISGDGRFVAFQSTASNLVPGDTNGTWDVIVHDNQTGTTDRISVASDGTEGWGGSGYPSVSSDGRFVAFGSIASNLVPGDTNSTWDVFVHDRQSGMTTRVSVAGDGSQANADSAYPSISSDGRFVAFESNASNLVAGDTNGLLDVFVHDRQSGSTTRIAVASTGTQPGADPANPSISADGRFVAFHSFSSSLVTGDTNSAWDVFVHDRLVGTTARISVASDGTEGSGDSANPFLSADGRFVSFRSLASNLVPGDTNSAYDFFLHDRLTGATTRISVGSGGTQANAPSGNNSQSYGVLSGP